MIMRYTRMMKRLTATAIGALATIVSFAVRLNNGDLGDFWWALRQAADVWTGRDPYGFAPSALMVPYPMPVIVFGFPLLWLNWSVASALFFGVSTGLLAYGCLRAKEGWRLAVLVSWPYAYALIYAQWSPLIMAAWYFPVLAPLLVTIKPHIALPVVLGRGATRIGLLIAAVVVLATLVINPAWPLQWLGMIGSYERVIPIVACPFLLLSLTGWRSDKGRLLIGMSLLPFRGMYDLCALWLLPRNAAQALALSALSWLLFLLPWNVGAWWASWVLFLPLCLLLTRGRLMLLCLRCQPINNLLNDQMFGAAHRRARKYLEKYL